MTWVWEGEEHKFVGGATQRGPHYAREYSSAGGFPGCPKPKLSDLPAVARRAVAYPPARQINGTKLTAREFKFVQMLSCKSRVVFWLYHKFQIPARDIGSMFGNSIIDQHSVYIRNGPIKRAMFAIQNKDKSIDWGEAKLLRDDGATVDEIAAFYGLNVATVKRNVR